MNEEFQGLALVELIDLLEEVPEPLAIPMTPQTPGWIALAAVILVIGLVLVRWGVNRHRANAYRRAALHELEEARDDPSTVAAILRRTAIAAYPREKVASLSGAQWLAFLDRTASRRGFADGPGRVFATAPFRPHGPDPVAASLARDWVKHHKIEVGRG